MCGSHYKACWMRCDGARCFAGNPIGELRAHLTSMAFTTYCRNMPTYVELSFVFQQGNNPKQTCRLRKAICPRREVLQCWYDLLDQRIKKKQDCRHMSSENSCIRRVQEYFHSKVELSPVITYISSRPHGVSMRWDVQKGRTNISQICPEARGDLAHWQLRSTWDTGREKR